MVPFAGYEMPVQYEGIIAEHLWTRENAGLFDVSHMGQLLISGPDVEQAGVLAHPEMLGENPFKLNRHVIAGKGHHPGTARAMPPIERQSLDWEFFRVVHSKPP